MKQKKAKTSLWKILGAAYGLCFSGVILLALGFGIQYRWNTTLGIALAVLGLVALISSLVLAGARLRCPHCAASLMQGGRLPYEVPHFCPNCGKPLE